MQTPKTHLNQSSEAHMIVQKYGGATLADSDKILGVARRISELARTKKQIVVVVSAMGQTTNSLIALAEKVSQKPSRREMDMLLSTGERVSMSLLSMALNDLGCPAISFTGSQAGIFTNPSHVDALIEDIKAFRVQEALAEGKVVILAGFQGVSPKTKEITTIGRGGSDLTAVAMSAFLKANICEILKDVPAVFSADPRLVDHAKPLSHLTYDQLLDMTFWGAKVLHYRSVELAKLRNVNLYIGPASSHYDQGTLINGDNMNQNFESAKVISVNSHEEIIELQISLASGDEPVSFLKDQLDQNQIPFPQILCSEQNQTALHIFVAGAKESLNAIKKNFAKNEKIKIGNKELSSLTATCSGIMSPELHSQCFQQLKNISITPLKTMASPLSLSFFVLRSQREEALRALHQLTE